MEPDPQTRARASSVSCASHRLRTKWPEVQLAVPSALVLRGRVNGRERAVGLGGTLPAGSAGPPGHAGCRLRAGRRPRATSGRERRLGTHTEAVDPVSAPERLPREAPRGHGRHPAVWGEDSGARSEGQSWSRCRPCCESVCNGLAPHSL